MLGRPSLRLLQGGQASTRVIGRYQLLVKPLRYESFLNMLLPVSHATLQITVPQGRHGSRIQRSAGGWAYQVAGHEVGASPLKPARVREEASGMYTGLLLLLKASTSGLDGVFKACCRSYAQHRSLNYHLDKVRVHDSSYCHHIGGRTLLGLLQAAQLGSHRGCW